MLDLQELQANLTSEKDMTNALVQRCEDLEKIEAELEEQNRRLQAKNADLKGKETQLEEQNSNLQGRNADLEAKETQLEGQNSRLQERNDELLKDKDGLENVIRQLHMNLAREQAKAKALDEQNEKLATEKRAAEDNAEQLKLELKTQSGRRELLEQRVAELKTQKSDVQAEVESAKNQLSKEEETSHSLRQELRDSIAASNDELAKRQIASADLQIQLNQGQRERDQLVASIQFQLSQFCPSLEDNMSVVTELADLVSKSTDSRGVVDVARTAPFTIFYSRQSEHARSAPYLFWIASQFGPLDDIFTNAQALFGQAEVSASCCPWTESALNHLARRFIQDSMAQIETARVTMLVLHGVAFLHGLESSYFPNSLIMTVDRYIEQLDDGFILRSMLQNVMNLLTSHQPIISWLPDHQEGIRTLNHLNSVLAEGTELVGDRSGLFLLSRTIMTETSIYVFTAEDVESVDVRRGATTLRLEKSSLCGVPSEMRILTLGVAYGEAMDWAGT